MREEKIVFRKIGHMFLLSILLFVFAFTHASAANDEGLETGMWRGVIQLKDETLPFNFLLTDSAGAIVITIINAEEKIRVTEITVAGDSLFIHMPLFDSEFRVKYEPGKMTGLFLNHTRRDNNVFPFYASAGISSRFDAHKEASVDISGKWECDFSPGTADSSKAIGEFVQTGNQLHGTFLTTSGDYRYLQGLVFGDSLALSAFDGSHLFLFKGVVDKEGVIHGRFFSGNHWREDWIAVRNEKVELPDPYSITYLKPGYTSLAFSFPDVNRKMVSLTDPAFKNKVVIVQIMGTWCPNCMDETEYYSRLYHQFHQEGLEIIGIAFERFPEFEKAQANLKRLQQKFGIQYPLLFGGQTGESAAKALPMLNGINGYPTSVFIDRAGNVRNIYTGINGPATGDAYEKWKDDVNALIEKLLREK